MTDLQAADLRARLDHRRPGPRSQTDHGADGRHHHARLPAQRAALGRRAGLHGDDQLAGHPPRQPPYAGLPALRRRRAPDRLSALRRRPARPGARRRRVSAGRRRPDRHQHGLPGAQGRQDRRRRGAAGGARACGGGMVAAVVRRRGRGRAGDRQAARRPADGRRGRAPAGAPPRRRRRRRRLSCTRATRPSSTAAPPTTRSRAGWPRSCRCRWSPPATSARASSAWSCSPQAWRA